MAKPVDKKMTKKIDKKIAKPAVDKKPDYKKPADKKPDYKKPDEHAVDKKNPNPDYNNRVPSMWMLRFSTELTGTPGCFVVCAKNAVHARKRMKNSYSNDKFAYHEFPCSQLDFKNEDVVSYNPSTKEQTRHSSVLDMIDNAWLQPFAENMIAFSALDGK